jgi:hypothetical protein
MNPKFNQFDPNRNSDFGRPNSIEYSHANYPHRSSQRKDELNLIYAASLEAVRIRSQGKNQTVGTSYQPKL